MENNKHFKYKRFLTFLENTLSGMNKSLSKNESLKDSIVKTLEKQLVNPLIKQGGEYSDIRNMIKKIIHDSKWQVPGE